MPQRPQTTSRLSEVLDRHSAAILEDWMVLQRRATKSRTGIISDDGLRAESRRFLDLLVQATSNGVSGDESSSHWDEVRAMLSDLSRTRAQQGFSPSETATFVFSLKQPVFERLRQDASAGKDTESLFRDVWALTETLDRLGLHTTEAYQEGREEVIRRQQRELLELSTPVTRLWDGVLAVPLIGTLDSERTQTVMEALLTAIVESGAELAIIDITGVPTVDTLVAQHLLKTVAAARLMGAECIISGIRPQIAQTIVHLGVNLGDVVTKATLADAFALALQRRGLAVTRALPKA